MNLELRPFTAAWTGAVRDLNARLLQRGFRGTLLPDAPAAFGDGAAEVGLSRSSFLLTEGDLVRGGYVLKQQEFFFAAGGRRAIGNFQAPVSEGVVDKRYALVGLQLLMDAIQRQPLLFCLGIGGPEELLTRMLASARWRIHPVGFFFRVVRPTPFLRQIEHLRTTPWRRRALDLLASSRLASVPIRCCHYLLDRYRRLPRLLEVSVVPSFEGWADLLWEQSQPAYVMLAVRDAAALNVLYPVSDRRFYRLRVRREESTVGWAVVMNNALRGHRHFGSLRLGSVVDALAVPGYEASVAAAATRLLKSHGADLIVSNQCHREWSAALRGCGYLRGPSNFLLAVSPALAAALEPYDETRERIHMNRGDGDGPIHL
jgi:hypothetical protein